ncbi:MAG: hypothetical protein M3024_14490 [Candidatus Dormibacteraeota bacterium]|nr:hypothetical protein [Candidatus Dormibacteraeota bacterium]
MRQPILYADQLWRSQRFYPIGLVLIGIVITIISLTVPAWRSARSGFSLGGVYINYNAVWLAYIPAGIALAGIFLYNRWRSQAEVTEEALVVRKTFTAVPVAFELIRGVRVQPLSVHFPDSRKRYVRPMFRALMPKPALFLRLRAEDPRTPDLVKRLGGQLAYGDTLALPIADPDAMSWEVSSRLPQRVGVNQGGQRRKKRAR